MDLYNHNWSAFELSNIIGAKTSDGVSLKLLFLQDYEKTFNEKPNAGCNKCLQDYLNKFKKLKAKKMKLQTNYKLFEKYNNINLRSQGEGYNVYVNNDNLTDEYAEILLERFAKEKIFEVYPAENKKVSKNVTPAGSTKKDATKEVDPKEVEKIDVTDAEQVTE